MRPIPALTLAVLTVGLTLFLAVPAGSTAAEALAADVFARVDQVEISGAEYLTVLRGRARQKFYHGEAPEHERAAFRREVGDFLISRALLAKEAERLGVEADSQVVAKRLAALERRYAQDPRWATDREQILAQLERQLVRISRVEALEARIRAVAAPSEADLRNYYTQHPDKFTTPERQRVSLILLRVAPSAPPETWRETHDRMRELAAQLQAGGTTFEALAQLHSQDPSADQGGDLGFIHRDRLGNNVQAVLDAMPVGAVSEPVQVLDGYALFRLVERERARLNPLQDVRERAEGLWRREAEEQAWTAYQQKLRTAAEIVVNEDYFRPGVEDFAAQGVQKGNERTSGLGPHESPQAPLHDRQGQTRR